MAKDYSTGFNLLIDTLVLERAKYNKLLSALGTNIISVINGFSIPLSSADIQTLNVQKNQLQGKITALCAVAGVTIPDLP